MMLGCLVRVLNNSSPPPGKGGSQCADGLGGNILFQEVLAAGSPGRRRESDNLPEPQPVGRAGEFIERVRSANGPKSPKRPEAAGSTPTPSSALLEAARSQQPNGLASAWPNGVAGELEQSQQVHPLLLQPMTKTSSG